MKMRFVVLLLTFPAICAADETRLFAVDTPLDLVFEFPTGEIISNADDRPVVEGSVHYTDENGAPVRVGLTMTTRGKSRLEYCHFPPLSANFKGQDKDGTLFEGQKKIKIVTQCRSGALYQRYLLQEFGIYRAFNVLTEQSFRVRLINATYRDSLGKKKDIIASAFFLESDNELADRLGMQKHDISIINPRQLDSEYASLFALFQYLIGNTDWSTLKGPDEEGCCHNGKVVIPPGAETGWLVIPYDFDQSGIIYTKYSSPADALGLKSVKQRLYRGRCMNMDHLDATVALFNAERAEIQSALLPDELQGRYRETAVRYIDDFYKIVNDPLQREKHIENRCLGE
ncbi:MAG TPA: hypothetical protein VLB07_03760 [Woeseiaceae bacterium]|nr:hypothetical protein [Woeseiaceae bacterium]